MIKDFIDVRTTTAVAMPRASLALLQHYIWRHRRGAGGDGSCIYNIFATTSPPFRRSQNVLIQFWEPFLDTWKLISFYSEYNKNLALSGGLELAPDDEFFVALRSLALLKTFYGTYLLTKLQNIDIVEHLHIKLWSESSISGVLFLIFFI
jgi:hypothetical protein